MLTHTVGRRKLPQLSKWQRLLTKLASVGQSRLSRDLATEDPRAKG